MPLPRTNWQKKEKSGVACFKMNSFLWRQPQRVRVSRLSSGGHGVPREECFFEGRLTAFRQQTSSGHSVAGRILCGEGSEA